MPSIEEEVKHLTKQLQLTDEQKPKIKAILQGQRDQMKALMEDSSATREEKMPKMKEIHESSSAKIKAILTDEQKTKYDKMEQERRKHMDERRGPPPGENSGESSEQK